MLYTPICTLQKLVSYNYVILKSDLWHILPYLHVPVAHGIHQTLFFLPTMPPHCATLTTAWLKKYKWPSRL